MTDAQRAGSGESNESNDSGEGSNKDSPEIHSDYPGKHFSVARKDSQSGLGVICHTHFKAGDRVSGLQGQIVPEVLQHTLQIAPGKHLLDRDFSGYFLHSCAPNISVDMDRMEVTALQDIKPGEYLLMDYAQTEDVLFKQFQCRCGSPDCRGLIKGRAE